MTDLNLIAILTFTLFASILLNTVFIIEIYRTQKKGIARILASNTAAVTTIAELIYTDKGETSSVNKTGKLEIRASDSMRKD